MTGILVVAHANLGQALIETVEFIIGSPPEGVAAISIDIKMNPDSLLKKIKKGIKSVQDDDGVIIFTDMFGGTPSNLSYSFLEDGVVEVITGVNLPILLKAITIREKKSFQEVPEIIVAHGRKSISRAGGILRGEENRQDP